MKSSQTQSVENDRTLGCLCKPSKKLSHFFSFALHKIFQEKIQLSRDHLNITRVWTLITTLSNSFNRSQ